MQFTDLQEIEVINEALSDNLTYVGSFFFESRKQIFFALVNGIERDTAADQENQAKGKGDEFSLDAQFYFATSASMSFQLFRKGAIKGAGISSNFVVFSNSWSVLLPSAD